MAKPNIRDVAKQAHVSLGTVSNVLNRPNQVSEETRQKVRNAIDMLGFMPKAHAKGSAVNVIGLIMPLSDNPFYTKLAQGVEDAIAKSGLSSPPNVHLKTLGSVMTRPYSLFEEIQLGKISAL